MLTVRVQSVIQEATGIRSFMLVSAAGARLPDFEPGAHIDVEVPGGHLRQYSLCDPPWEGHYRIAVLDVQGGRGGSAAMHREVRRGDLLRISHPRNTFPLVRNARHSILVAGGIGITPIISMAQQLDRQQGSYELHYCTRAPDRTAFLDRILLMERAGKAHLHFDGGEPGRHLDSSGMLKKYEEGAHLYFCGPNPFMQALRAASAHWPRATVHWEYFGSPQGEAPEGDSRTQFKVELIRSKRVIRVSGEESILSGIRKAGIHCPSSCEAGVCGTCRTRYVSGRAIHGDYLLTEEERREFLLPCSARVADNSLVLDL
jgi:vanillate O-demethylase ferredoxin subunit